MIQRLYPVVRIEIIVITLIYYCNYKELLETKTREALALLPNQILLKINIDKMVIYHCVSLSTF